MAVHLVRCEACGRQIVLAAYRPDLVNSRTPSRRRRASYKPLDVVPRPRDDEYANYALSAGRTTCHRITEAWPLHPAETRHTIHFATCPARIGHPTDGEADDD